MPAKKKSEKKTAKKTETKEKAVKKPAKKHLKKENVKEEIAEQIAVKPAKAGQKDDGRKIKGVIFDFWGTLVENGIFPSPIRKIKFMLNLEMHFSEYVVIFEEAFMKQKFNDLYEGFTNVLKAFNIEPDRKTLDLLVGMWNKNKMFAKPYYETIEVLEQLRKDGYKIALISNSDCFSIKDVMDKFGLAKHFDTIVMSYEEGLLKSDKRMFGKVLENIGLSEGEVVMVGDSVESDMSAAQNAGIKGILIDRRNRREYPGKILSLKELKDAISPK